jgi:hypothetical protein
LQRKPIAGALTDPCDALSLAVGITVAPVRLGPTAGVDSGVGACGKEPTPTCD